MNMIRAAVPLLTLSLALAACSSTGGGATPAASAAAPTPAATPAASPSAAAGGATINLADATLGKILTDGAGKTLYVFTPDSDGKSACTGDCLAKWPALISDAAPTVGAGLDAASFATITRDDGAKQVTFFGHPLYYFAADAAAGDTNGQGLGGKWFVVGADGKMIGAEASPAASPSAAAGAVSVSLADNTLGKILVGADGKTLYVFTNDKDGKSACTGDCAGAWPPLLGDTAPTLGAGLDADDFTTIKRDDGSSQIAFYGQPLYYFAADAAAGDTKGQALNGKWYVVDADGKMIK